MSPGSNPTKDIDTLKRSNLIMPKIPLLSAYEFIR